VAKYDTYELKLVLMSTQVTAELNLSILFEEGDDHDAVIALARQKLRTEAIAMKNAKFLSEVTQ
jgi:hypothetical protein